MKKIQLTKGYEATVDDADFDELSKYNWHASPHRSKGSKEYRFYAERNIRVGEKWTKISMHRQLMGLGHGDPRMVDHRDMDTMNCTRANLRLTDKRGNGANRRPKPDHTSKFLGVCKYRDKWMAQIVSDDGYGNDYLGVFKNEEDAARAYNEAAVKKHGEFARLNQIAA
jgi:hypothetical protein